MTGVRRLLILAFLLALVLGGVSLLRDPLRDRKLPSEGQAATVFAKEDATLPHLKRDRIYGWRKPFDCRRTDSDISIEDLVEDVDFVCTPRKKSGGRCEVGECAGFAVDFDGTRVEDFRRFGV